MSEQWFCGESLRSFREDTETDTSADEPFPPEHSTEAAAVLRRQAGEA